MPESCFSYPADAPLGISNRSAAQWAPRALPGMPGGYSIITCPVAPCFNYTETARPSRPATNCFGYADTGTTCFGYADTGSACFGYADTGSTCFSY